MTKDIKPTRAWWIDTESNLGNITWGDEITGIVTEERLQKLIDLEKVSLEEPEDKEKVTGSQVDKLRAAVVVLQDEKKELEDQIAKTPKGVKEVRVKLKKAETELKEFKKSALKSDPAKTQEIADLKVLNQKLETQAINKSVVIENLTDKVDELATDLKDKLGDGLDEDLTKKLGEIDELAKKLTADPDEEGK